MNKNWPERVNGKTGKREKRENGQTERVNGKSAETDKRVNSVLVHSFTCFWKCYLTSTVDV